MTIVPFITINKVSDRDEVKELLEIADKYITIAPDQTCTQTLNHPFIVVEGMDATGNDWYYNINVLL